MSPIMMTHRILPALVATLALACTGLPAMAQGIAPGFRPDDPRFAALNRTYDTASDLQERVGGAAEGRASVIAALEKARDAAQRTRLSDGSAHPLAAAAAIKIASQQRENGEVASSIPALEQAIATLAPYRAHYFRTYAEGLALLAQNLSEAGRPADSLAMLERGVREYDEWFAARSAADRDPAAWMSKSNLEYAYAYALFRNGQRDKAVDMQRRTLASRIASVGENNADVVSARYWLANFLLRAGHGAEAEAEARRAVETAIAHVSPGHPSYARSLELLGLVLTETGRPAEAVGYMRRSLEVKRANGDAAYLAYAQHNLGTVLIDLERHAEAREVLFDAAKGIGRTEGQLSPQGLNTLAFAAQSAFAMSDTQTAIGEFEKVDARFNELRLVDPTLRARAVPPLVMALLDAGQAERARAVAASWAVSLKAPDPAGQTLALQALALQELANDGSTPAARAAAERLVASIDAGQIVAANGQIGSDQRLSLDLALRIAAAAGDADLGLRAMDLLARSKVAHAGRLVAARLLTQDPALAATVRGVQDLAREAQSRDRDLLSAWATGKDVDAARAAQERAVAALEAGRRDLAGRWPHWSAASATRPPTLATLRETLGDGEAVLGVVPAFEGAYVLVVTRKAATIRRTVPGREGLARLAQRLRVSLEGRSFDAEAAQALHAALFTASEQKALERTRAIRLVTAGPLANIPFSLLLTRPVQEIDRDTPWLLRRFAFTVQPGFTALPASEAPSRREAAFIGIGAPRPFGEASPPQGKVLSAASYFRSGTADRAALAALPPLPGAARELTEIAKRFGPQHARLLTGDNASEAAIRKGALENFGVIMFATHGLVGGRTEGSAEPALVLSPPAADDAGTDGLLTASEVASLRLGADWVILSACNTAAGEEAGSEAYAGLAQAFLYAGARSMLVSHWPLRDDAAAFLTVRAVRAASGGASKAEALRRAQLALIADRSIADSADPFIWAPFVLLGN